MTRPTVTWPWSAAAKGRRVHLFARNGDPACFSRGSRGPLARISTDLDSVDCTRCLSIVEMDRALSDRAWAYYRRIVDAGRAPS